VPVRVLIADDSRIVRGVLRRVLQHFPDFLVVGEAGDGKRAEQLAKELRPDVITMDLLMPMMGGIDTIEAIMRDCPTPIVVVADLEGADRGVALEATARGALEVFPKPRHGFDDATARALAETLRMSASMVVRRPGPASLRKTARVALRRGPVAIVGIVASTGGPRVLQAILRALPRGLPCPIAIVQHTMAGSTEPLADWLRKSSGHAVTVACAGEQLSPGQVVVAPDGTHLTITTTQTVVLDHGPRIDSHRPSGTVLLKSLATHFRAQAVGVLLSGMGADGAEGLAAIEAAGGSILVEDPATAVVGGMPAAALARTTTAFVESADELGRALLRLLGK